MIYKINMISRSELFCLPFLGVFAEADPKGFIIGEIIEFELFGQIINKGTIVAIESPKSNVRNLPTKNEKFKIHWVPVIAVSPIELSTTLCPKGCTTRSAVYLTRKVGHRIQRYRKCPNCKTRWTTIESFEELVPSERKARK